MIDAVRPTECYLQAADCDEGSRPALAVFSETGFLRGCPRAAKRKVVENRRHEINEIGDESADEKQNAEEFQQSDPQRRQMDELQRPPRKSIYDRHGSNLPKNLCLASNQCDEPSVAWPNMWASPPVNVTTSASTGAA